MIRSKKKALIAISSVLIVILVGIIVALCVIMIPMKGKAYIELWRGPEQVYDIEKDSVIVQKKDVHTAFQIIQLTDIQLWSNSKDNDAALEIAETVIKVSAPDLVVLTGDNVSGVSAPELLKKLIERMEKLAIKYNFLWAPVFGNHDSEFGSRTTKNWAGDRYLEVSVENGGHCLFRKGPTNLGDEYGDLLGNYVINVKEGEQIVQSLYMLDNGVYADYDDELRDEVYQKEGRYNRERPFPYAQIEWCKWQASNINKIAGKKVPSIAFTHCAPYEMGQTLLKYVAGPDGKLNTDDDLQKQDQEGYWTIPGGYTSGSSEQVLEYPIVDGKELRGLAGSFAYVPSHALYNTGIVESMKELGLKGWFVGHDHENDIIFEYDDMVYGYGLKTGPSPKPWNGSRSFGGTIIFMENDGKINLSHLRVDYASSYWNK